MALSLTGIDASEDGIIEQPALELLLPRLISDQLSFEADERELDIAAQWG